jgi:hypothetical protein
MMALEMRLLVLLLWPPVCVGGEGDALAEQGQMLSWVS